MGLSVIEIDADRLRRNVRVFRRLLGKRTKLMAVVKANAYGHGARLVAPLLRSDVDWFGVDGLDEGEELRAVGVEEPIAILGHTEPELAERVVAGGFRQVVFRRDLAEAMREASRKLRKPAHLHLEVETGLNRLGVPLSELEAFTGEGLEGLEGIYTHFADVEDPESTLAPQQIERLREAVSRLAALGYRSLLVHASPTAGVLLREQKGLALARVGIGLYGIWPSPETRKVVAARAPGTELLPVLSWKSRLVQVKTVRAGETVGYDLTYRAAAERRIGVVPVGYYDGYDRSLSNRGQVLVRGRRSPVAGRIAMNMLMVDVTEAGGREGDEVVLIGEQGQEGVSADELASWAGTIPYEILARLSPKLPRIEVVQRLRR